MASLVEESSHFIHFWKVGASLCGGKEQAVSASTRKGISSQRHKTPWQRHVPSTRAHSTLFQQLNFCAIAQPPAASVLCFGFLDWRIVPSMVVLRSVMTGLPAARSQTDAHSCFPDNCTSRRETRPFGFPACLTRCTPDYHLPPLLELGWDQVSAWTVLPVLICCEGAFY